MTLLDFGTDAYLDELEIPMSKKLTLPDGRVVHLYDRNVLRRKRPTRMFLGEFRGIRAALPTSPATCDWTKGNTLSFPILGNDREGDCYFAAACHQSQTWTGNVGAEDAFDQAAVLAAYQKLSGGDNGLSTDQIMGYWKGGLLGGPHRILDEMAVSPTSQSSMELAIHLFGGTLFTLAIPDDWVANPVPGFVWDAPATPDQNNGHAVLFNGYLPTQYTLQTWAFDPPGAITPAGVAVCDPEATVCFSLDWFNAAGVAPNGFTYDQLAAFWVQLGGNALPPFSPTPVPTPVPTPGPTPEALFHLSIGRNVPAGGGISFRSPVALKAGSYAVSGPSSSIRVPCQIQ